MMQSLHDNEQTNNLCLKYSGLTLQMFLAKAIQIKSIGVLERGSLTVEQRNLLLFGRDNLRIPFAAVSKHGHFVPCTTSKFSQVCLTEHLAIDTYMQLWTRE